MNESTSPLISVVIPVYNVLSFLNECVESVLKQTYTNLEIILVDDGSTDGSGEACDEIALRDLRIRVIHQANKGLGGARNAGTSASSGTYITYIDSDDVIDVHMVEKLWSLLSSAPNYVAACNACAFFDGETPAYTLQDASVEVLSCNQAIEKIMYQNGELETSACGKMYPKHILIDNQILFPDTYYEDLATVYKIIQKSDGMRYALGKGYGYRQRKNGIMLGGFSPQKGQDILKVCSDLTTAFQYASNEEKSMISCRCFSAVCNVLMTIQAGEYTQDEAELWTAVKKYRKGVIWNKKARLKNRAGAAVSYLGKKLFRSLYRFFVSK